VNLDPRHRVAGLVALAHDLEQRARGLDQAVAVHAGLRGGHAGGGGFLDRGVAIAAVDAQLARVQAVFKGNGLDRLVADAQVGRVA